MRVVMLLFMAVVPLLAQSDWQTDLRMAQYYEKSQQSAEAVKYYETAWQKSKGSQKVYTTYYKFLRKTGLWEKASKISLKMHQKDKRSFMFVNDFGRALVNLGHKNSADSLWNAQLKRKDISVVHIQSMANTMLQLRLLDEAVIYLEKGYIKFPKQNSILLQIASLYQNRLSFKKAADFYLRYLKLNTNHFNVVQSRMLNMLDNWEDAESVLSYIKQKSSEPEIMEISSAIYMKFKKYDQAYPLLTSNYGVNKRLNYNRYIQYARQAQNEGQTVFALDLINFLLSNSDDQNKKKDLLLAKYEIIFNTFTATVPVDTVVEFLKILDQYVLELDSPRRGRAYKLYVKSYHYLVNDLDNAALYALRGLKSTKNIRQKDFYYLELIKIALEKGDFQTIKKLQNRLKNPENLSKAGFYGLLADYKISGIAVLEKNMKSYMRKTQANHPRFNDMIQIQLVLTRADTANKKDLLNGLVYFHQKKYALAEYQMSEFLNSHKGKASIDYLLLDLLFRAHEFTGSDVFITQAEQMIKYYPKSASNAKILWFLSQIDVINSERHLNTILNQFPDSYEADKARELVRRKERELG